MIRVMMRVVWRPRVGRSLTCKLDLPEFQFNIAARPVPVDHPAGGAVGARGPTRTDAFGRGLASLSVKVVFLCSRSDRLSDYQSQ